MNLISAYLYGILQKSIDGTANKSSSKGAVESSDTQLESQLTNLSSGQVIEGKVQAKTRDLTFIDTEQGVLKAKGALNIPKGAKVRLKVLEPGYPAKVKVESWKNESQPPASKVQGLLAQSKANLSRLGLMLRQDEFSKALGSQISGQGQNPKEAISKEPLTRLFAPFEVGENTSSEKVMEAVRLSPGLSKVIQKIVGAVENSAEKGGEGSPLKDKLPNMEVTKEPESKGQPFTNKGFDASSFKDAPSNISNHKITSQNGKPGVIQDFSEQDAKKVVKSNVSLTDKGESKNGPIFRDSTPLEKTQVVKEVVKEEGLQQTVLPKTGKANEATFKVAQEQHQDPSSAADTVKPKITFVKEQVLREQGVESGEEVSKKDVPQSTKSQTVIASKISEPTRQIIDVYAPDKEIKESPKSAFEPQMKDELQSSETTKRPFNKLQLNGEEQAIERHGKHSCVTDFEKGGQQSETSTLSTSSKDHAHSFLKGLATQLELSHEIHTHFAQKGMDLFVIPFFFSQFQGVGQWIFWQEKDAAQIDKEEGAISHLVFDLNLKNLGKLDIHLLKKEQVITVCILAEDDKVSMVRHGLVELAQELKAAGFKMGHLEVKAASEADGDPVSEAVPIVDIQGFHVVT